MIRQAIARDQLASAQENLYVARAALYANEGDNEALGRYWQAEERSWQAEERYWWWTLQVYPAWLRDAGVASGAELQARRLTKALERSEEA